MLVTVAEERRVEFDLDAYQRRVHSGPCFVCQIAHGDQDDPQEVIFNDGRHLVFLARPQVLLGNVLVAPVEHREAVTGEFSLEEYLDLQKVVYRTAQALAQSVPTERIYLLSLGSQQGNAHVHWHVAALPPGVPYEEQQFRALMVETKGVLALTSDEQAALEERLRTTLNETR